jgi:excisionase family DNA binding protein
MVTGMTGTNGDQRTAIDGDAPDRLAYRLKEVATLLGVSIWTVRTLIDNGQLKHRKAGKYNIVSRSEIERYLAADEKQSA